MSDVDVTTYRSWMAVLDGIDAAVHTALATAESLPEPLAPTGDNPAVALAPLADRWTQLTTCLEQTEREVNGIEAHLAANAAAAGAVLVAFGSARQKLAEALGRAV